MRSTAAVRTSFTPAVAVPTTTTRLYSSGDDRYWGSDPHAPIDVSPANPGIGTFEAIPPNAETAAQAQLNKYSAVITQRKTQGAGQSQLYGTGMTPDDMQKPQIGIMSNWFEGNPCNMHLDDPQTRVWEGVEAVGMKGMRYTAIGVSDGISNGTDGMACVIPLSATP